MVVIAPWHVQQERRCKTSDAWDCLTPVIMLPRGYCVVMFKGDTECVQPGFIPCIPSKKAALYTMTRAAEHTYVSYWGDIEKAEICIEFKFLAQLHLLARCEEEWIKPAGRELQHFSYWEHQSKQSMLNRKHVNSRAVEQNGKWNHTQSIRHNNSYGVTPGRHCTS